MLSTASIERAWRWWAGRHGLEWDEVARHVPGRKAVDTITACLPRLPDEVVEREANLVNERQVSDAEDDQSPPGVLSLVRALPPPAWGVVTACPLRLAEARLKRAGYEMPSVIVTAENVPRGKPDPSGYLLGARRLGVGPGSCLVVEDAPVGIQAGRAAGMTVLGMATTHRVEDLFAADAVVPDARYLRVGVGDTFALYVDEQPLPADR